MLVDNSALDYDKVIYDWIAGDSRIFTRTYIFQSPNQLDTAIAAFLTLKANPNSIDQNSLLQVKITPVLTASGQIINTLVDGIEQAALTFQVYAAQIEPQMKAGTSYYYDIRIITTNGFSYTIETGTVFAKQGVTQADAAGTPAAQPDQGIPIFRGFAAYAPINGGPYNVGDIFSNSNPIAGGPSGWICIAAGIPGVWRTNGIVGDTDGT